MSEYLKPPEIKAITNELFRQDAVLGSPPDIFPPNSRHVSIPPFEQRAYVSEVLGFCTSVEIGFSHEQLADLKRLVVAMERYATNHHANESRRMAALLSPDSRRVLGMLGETTTATLYPPGSLFRLDHLQNQEGEWRLTDFNTVPSGYGQEHATAMVTEKVTGRKILCKTPYTDTLVQMAAQEVPNVFLTKLSTLSHQTANRTLIRILSSQGGSRFFLYRPEELIDEKYGLMIKMMREDAKIPQVSTLVNPPGGRVLENKLIAAMFNIQGSASVFGDDLVGLGQKLFAPSSLLRYNYHSNSFEVAKSLVSEKDGISCDWQLATTKPNNPYVLKTAHSSGGKGVYMLQQDDFYGAFQALSTDRPDTRCTFPLLLQEHIPSGIITEGKSQAELKIYFCKTTHGWKVAGGKVSLSDGLTFQTLIVTDLWDSNE